MDIIDKLGPLYVQRDGEYFISGKWAFYMYSNYGLPIEIFQDITNDYMKNLAKEYDNIR